ncbi:MFS transporter [Nakamurella flava]|uniref:MFS transporter n=1 Tax=Nakamurella flava TaxID=2576308 RepID=A0A4U6QLQ8_9ACTN|nr:MFS transporter [Nakamurella flava]TKV61527.1 MFS transporter [Nakamurella flava]
MSTPEPFADPRALTRSQVTAWRNALFVIFGVVGVGMASWVARTPTIRDSLQASTWQMGLVVFGLSCGAILGLLAASTVIEKFGTKAIMVFGLSAGGLGLAGAGVGAALGSFPLVVAALAVYGIGNSTCDVAMNVSGAANERALGRTVMPLYHAAFSMGTVVGAGIGALAEFLQVPVAVHLPLAGLVTAVVGVWCVRYAREPIVDAVEDAADTTTEPVVKRSWFARWADTRTLLIGLIVLGMAFAEGSANDWLALSLVDGYGTSNTVGAVGIGLFVAAMTVGRVAGVRLLDKYGRVPVLRVSAVFAVVGLSIVIFSPSIVLAAFGVVLWGLGAALGFPVGMSAAADDPARAAERVSAVATIGYLAFLVGPPLIGFLGEHFGLLNGLLAVLVLIVIAGLVSGAAREPARTTTVASGKS